MTTPPKDESSHAPRREDLERIQLAQWVQNPQTQLALRHLRQLHQRLLIAASQVAANPQASDLILRLQLTKASTLETIINKIEKGELGNDQDRLI